MSKGQIVDRIYGLTALDVQYADLLLTGMSQRDAFLEIKPFARRWGDNAIASNASALARKVCVRNQKLVEANSQKQVMDIVSELETNVVLGRDLKQVGASNGALQLLARLSGLIDDRQQVNVQVNNIQMGVTWDDDGVPVVEGESDE